MEGDSYRISQIAQIVISIHSLRMEGDWSVVPLSPTVGYFNPLPPYGGRHISNATTQQDKLFQSTPSVWRETFLPRFSAFVAVISIHSLRMEGDVRYDHRQSAVRDFNPLPPYGGRHMGELIKQVAPNISIHSLRMEGDLSSRVSIDRTQNFNPLPPYGGRQITHELTDIPPAFQSTPSVWRETQGKRFCA